MQRKAPAARASAAGPSAARSSSSRGLPSSLSSSSSSPSSSSACGGGATPLQCALFVRLLDALDAALSVRTHDNELDDPGYVGGVDNFWAMMASPINLATLAVALCPGPPAAAPAKDWALALGLLHDRRLLCSLWDGEFDMHVSGGMRGTSYLPRLSALRRHRRAAVAAARRRAAGCASARS